MSGRRAALGGILMVGARLLTRLVDLATVLILARILLPADFGLVAIAMTLIFIAEAALELPVNQALLRLPVITAAQYDTAFTLSVLRGVVLALLLLLAAWPFARFYGDPRLVALVCVLGLGSVARGLVSPRLAEFQKHMSFWRDFVIEISGKAVGFGAGLATALSTGSYWALAAGTVVYPVTMAIVSYVLAPYRPRLSLAQSPIFLDFLGWMSAAQVVSAVNWQFERLLLGKLQSTTRLGLFTTANDLSSIPILALFGPIMRPLLAAFAQHIEDRAQLAASYQKAAAAILLIGVPLLVGECLVAEPLVLLLLGEQWHDATWLLRWLAISLVPSLFALPAIPLMMAFGHTRWVFWRNLLEFCIKLPIILVFGIRFGFAGVIFARIVSETLCALFCMGVVRKLIGLSVREQLAAGSRAAGGASVMAVIVLAGLVYLPAATGQVTSALRLGVLVGCGAASYAAVAAALWRWAGCPPGVEAVAMASIRRLASMTMPATPWRTPLKVRPEDS